MKRVTSYGARNPFYTKIQQDLYILKNIEVQEYRKNNVTWKVKDSSLKFQRCEDIVSMYKTYSSAEEKETLIDLLRDEITTTEVDDGFRVVCFLSLYQLGYGEEANEISLRQNTAPESFIYPIKDILENNIPFFGSEDLKILLFIFTWLEARVSEFEKRDAIISTIETINNIRYKSLLQRLNVTNTEINNDRIRVSELLKEYGFEEKYNKTLNILDKFIGGESDEELIPGGAIGTLREFFKSFYIDLAKKITQRNNLDEIPRNEKSKEEIGHAVNYIGKEFGLSGDEEKLLKGYTEIVNNNGSHSMLSEKKYLRLTRNIGIEISLFMLSKLKDYSSK